MTSQAKRPPPVAVIVAQYNASVTNRLRDAALEAYVQAGGNVADVAVIEAPGSFELPALALAAAKTGRFAGVVALGCVIQGETSHNHHIADAVAHGLIAVTLQTGVPATFGVITAETAGQAYARAGGREGNKGAESMQAVLETIAASEALATGEVNARCTLPKPDKAAQHAPGV
ncbi:MAG: 6,7-dimethyl-8-ribityllumazine synthase [Phycisphaerales bacterium]|nr:6,7-dimethyl-8-ribityllumazine synthase [Phycisphaerales bacterium]